MAKKSYRVLAEKSVVDTDKVNVMRVVIEPANARVRNMYPGEEEIVYVATGIARLNPEDEADPIIGKDLAAARAKRKCQLQYRDDLDSILKYAENLYNTVKAERLKLTDDINDTKELIEKLVDGTYKKN